MELNYYSIIIDFVAVDDVFLRLRASFVAGWLHSVFFSESAPSLDSNIRQVKLFPQH